MLGRNSEIFKRSTAKGKSDRPTLQSWIQALGWDSSPRKEPVQRPKPSCSQVLSSWHGQRENRHPNSASESLHEETHARIAPHHRAKKEDKDRPFVFFLHLPTVILPIVLTLGHQVGLRGHESPTSCWCGCGNFSVAFLASANKELELPHQGSA